MQIKKIIIICYVPCNDGEKVLKNTWKTFEKVDPREKLTIIGDEQKGRRYTVVKGVMTIHGVPGKNDNGEGYVVCVNY